MNNNMSEEEAKEKILGKVANILLSCPNLGKWEWCNEHCPIYRLCDDIQEAQNVSKLTRKPYSEIIKGFLSKIKQRIEEAK